MPFVLTRTVEHVMRLSQWKLNFFNFPSRYMHILPTLREWAAFTTCLPCTGLSSPEPPYTIAQSVYGALWTLYANCAPTGEHIFYMPLLLTYMLHSQNTGSKVKLKILRWWWQRLKYRALLSHCVTQLVVRLGGWSCTPDPRPLLWEGLFLINNNSAFQEQVWWQQKALW